MHNESRPGDQPGDTDPNEPTQAQDLSAAREDTEQRAEAAADRYTPVPEPRADWAHQWDAPVPPTPERWYEPAPIAQPITPKVTQRRGAGAGSLIAVALL